MVEYNGENYYTCTEIAKMLNDNQNEVKDLRAKVVEVYAGTDDYCFTDQYWQLRLYKARDNGTVRYISFLKNKNKRKCYAFAVADIITWLSTKEAAHPFKKAISDIEVHEVQV